MKNRGFTLVELLGVVAILAMLGLIVIPVISNVLSDNKKKLYDVQIKNIESAANSYISEHVFSVDIPVGTSKGVTLGTLKSLGYIGDVSDPITRQRYSDDMVIIISNTANGYVFKVCTPNVSCESVSML
jgi:prepilin-type N-terminal cleavage/methylation domain-containing protein